MQGVPLHRDGRYIFTQNVRYGESERSREWSNGKLGRGGEVQVVFKRLNVYLGRSVGKGVF
jgi:hypothetical protein